MMRCFGAELRFAIGVVVGAIVAGCGGGGSHGDGYAVRDSAGVRVVDNGAPDAAAVVQWRIAAEPQVDIGTLEGAPEYQLYHVANAVRLSDGAIVVANSGTQELRFYDATGRHLRSVGRDGGGPGEFRRLSRVLRTAGDTLLAFDSSLRRASWFSPSGEYLRSASVGHESSVIALVWGVFADGTLLGMSAAVFRPGDIAQGVTHDSTVYFRFTRDGAVIDTLGVLPAPEMYGRAEGRGFFMSSLPFGLVPSSAAAGERFYFGTSRRPEVAIRDASGRLVEIVRWQQPARPVTAADVEAEKARRLKAIDDRNMRRLTESVFADMPIPETMPFFNSMLVDAVGDLWVAEFAPTGQDARTWLVFDPDGRLAATVSMPAKLRVSQVGEDFVLGTWSDEMDVEHVRLFGLTRSGPEAG